MEANAENPASPHWRTLYNAAILELDCNRLPQRIAEAQRAINALNVLRDLQKMADGNGHSR